MSSLASLFNSCATLFTLDIYSKLRPGRPEKELVKVGRFATGIVVILGIVWIPIMHQMAGGGLYRYLQGVQSYLAPPITAVFLLGLFWSRINAKGAFYGLISGFVLGMTKLTLEAIHSGSAFADGSLLAGLAEFNFLYASGVLLLLSVITVVVVSLLSEAPNKEQIAGLTYGSLTTEDKKEIKNSWNGYDIAGTVVVIGLVIGFYLYFSFWLG